MGDEESAHLQQPNIEPLNIKVFIDESGIIRQGNVKHCDYFIIGLLMTSNAKRLCHVFKKSRLKVVQHKPELFEQLKQTKEVKGSQLTETEKTPIYKAIIDKCSEDIELGIIRLNNCTSDARFRSNCSMAFNFLIKLYLMNFFKIYSKFKNPNTIDFLIDERNVATNSRFTLCDYLNAELNLVNPISQENFTLNYADSKTSNLLQLIDFIANTYFRYYNKHNNEAKANVLLLDTILCHNQLFRFPL
jgi:hypothetical protein